jgi:hypothetical protein
MQIGSAGKAIIPSGLPNPESLITPSPTNRFPDPGQNARAI